MHVLPRQNIARDHSNDRPSFKSDGYYPFDVNEYYTRVGCSYTDLIIIHGSTQYLGMDLTVRPLCAIVILLH